jgi:EmrB/QacA subfamily drug resistance transporter
VSRIPYKWIVAIVFVCGAFMDVLDITIVNVAIPTLQREFDASTAQIEWVVLGYLLSLAVWIPASGWMGDRFGTKRVFLFALAMFTGASMLCGLANSLGELVAFRVLQGVGGGMLLPVGTAMLFRAFPPIERAKAASMVIVPTVLAPALGPVVGGWLVTDVSWRWIFFLNLPIGVAAFMFGLFALREHREETAGPFDLPGFVLSGSSLALILFALSEGPQKGWGAPVVIATGVCGVIAFAALVIVETHIPHPMLMLKLFKERMFRNANIVFGLTFGSFVGVLFLLPLFLQELRGLSALQSGLTTFPQAVGMIIASQVVSRLYHGVGPRRLIFWGMVAMAVCTIPLLFVDLATNLWWIRAIMLGRGMCMAFSFVPLQTATFANISPADTGRASAIFSTQRQVAAALGVALITTVLIERTNTLNAGVTNPVALAQGSLSAFHLAFGVAAAVILCAAFSSLMIRDSDAAATMRSRPLQGEVEPVVPALID